jgi:type IV pilus assembly protein PilQ
MMRTGLLALAVALLGAAPPRADRPTADVMAVSVLPATGRAELVIDVRGVVQVSDFVLNGPDRLVVDLVGARLAAPQVQYDGRARGGVRNVRYAQFRSDVVRVVVELDGPRDYEVRQEDEAVRIALEGATEGFTGWSSNGDVADDAGTALVVPATAPSAAATAPAARAPLPAAIPPRQPEARMPAPVAPPQASGQPRVSVTFDQATIQEVVANFAAFSGRSIVLGKDVTGNVTAEIRDQPWDIAFNAVLAGQGLTAVELPGGIIRVDTRTNLASADSTEPTTTRLVPINYARATALQPSIAGIVSARGRVVADTVNNAIIVTDLASRMGDVQAFIQALDVRTSQVAIQARIVFVDRTELENLGLRYDLGTSSQFYNELVQRPDPANPGETYDPSQTVVNLGGNAVAAVANASALFTEGSPALKLMYSTAIGDFALTAFLEALQSVTLSDIQAEPAVTVADNRNAYIFSGERTPIRQIDAGSAVGGQAARATTQLQPTGITLRVTPHVVAGTREILLDLHAERSAVTPSPISEIGAVFSSQEASTQLLVRDGETAVIGGLTVTEVTVTKSGIPFLVDLPVIGALFGFRSTKEARKDLLILVTPHIVDDITTGGTGGQNR